MDPLQFLLRREMDIQKSCKSLSSMVLLLRLVLTTMRIDCILWQ